MNKHLRVWLIVVTILCTPFVALVLFITAAGGDGLESRFSEPAYSFNAPRGVAADLGSQRDAAETGNQRAITVRGALSESNKIWLPITFNASAFPIPTREPSPYFPEGMEYPFGFEIQESSEAPYALCYSKPCTIVATYQTQTPDVPGPYGGKAFHFLDVGSGEAITLSVRSGYADRIHLVPETTYRLIAQRVWGWPSTFGLVIKEDDELVFLGLTDWELDRTVSIDCLSPIRAKRARILADNYREGDSCWARFTNIEIEFSQDGESVLLHQGQSATLGDYEIELEIARITDYRLICQDAGVNDVSFTISRRNPGGAVSSTRAIGTTETGPPASSEVVTFPDPALEWFIRRLIYKDSGPILASDLEQPTCLIKLYPPGWSLEEIPSQGQITDLRGLEHCTNLTEVILSGDDVTDLAPLAPLTNLTKLQVEYSTLSDLSPLEGLVALTHLQIDSNQVSDLSPLSSLTNLQHLDAGANKIADVSALSSLTSLSQLYLEGNRVTDLSPLSSLTGLTELSLPLNQIVDVSPLSALIKLTELSLFWNQIADISALSSLVNLTDLSLDTNQIADISALSSLVNLTDLWLNTNQIEDISALTPLIQLRTIDLHRNKIDDISPLVENTGLGEGDLVDLTGNPLRSDSFEADRQELISRGVVVRPRP